ncbi:uncharacterized protein C8Q71DRAFT_68320 [Rhodofomes roseus]|uniref:Uncharacterized protein n=1 Tax=Rhodofomes roseus TaxID=34475 RepID=A0ABQ8KFI2_9APHY|nr:uncharacterized protein C8Q71DRAFT_68320 [Rhodofomes roseus]KAH9836145.1 hypothetical protein C8Q71DRAFT_68320 [Rhodofomes roseus]
MAMLRSVLTWSLEAGSGDEDPGDTLKARNFMSWVRSVSGLDAHRGEGSAQIVQRVKDGFDRVLPAAVVALHQSACPARYWGRTPGVCSSELLTQLSGVRTICLPRDARPPKRLPQVTPITIPVLPRHNHRGVDIVGKHVLLERRRVGVATAMGRAFLAAPMPSTQYSPPTSVAGGAAADAMGQLRWELASAGETDGPLHESKCFTSGWPSCQSVADLLCQSCDPTGGSYVM